MLELRPNCECCDKDLPPTAHDAMICSDECTFCHDCVEMKLGGRCPNCGGELQQRPVRPAAKLDKHPASTTRVFKPLGCAAALLAVLALFFAAPASAQVAISGYGLPMKLALAAAQVAVDTCAERGYPVNAFVVDPSGLVIVQLRGDHATVHTKDSAFRKAYTIVTMGPIFGLDRTSEFVALVAKYPNGTGAQLASAPNVVALPGAVAIRHGTEIVAGLGVGGSPGGDKDEACAAAGVAAIADHVK